jgi:DNA-binding CsgD family transcriptional regulator
VSTAVSAPGFLLLDGECNPIAFNSEAIQILAFPSKPDRVKQLPIFLRDKVRSSLLHAQHGKVGLNLVTEYRSGARRYVCRAFHLDCDPTSDSHLSVAILLERQSSGTAAFDLLVQEFDLTQRESETVALLKEGLTSKEIANRMHISPNTVKAFLRLVMVKMDVSTRSGIVGRIVDPRS